MVSPGSDLPEDILAVLPRYFDGDPGARASVERWVGTDEGRAARIAGARALWDASGSQPEADEAEAAAAAWASFRLRVNSAGQPPAGEAD